TCWSNMLTLKKSTFMKGWKPTTHQFDSLYEQLFYYYFDYYATEIEEKIRLLDQPLKWYPPQWFENGKSLPSGRMGQVYLISCRGVVGITAIKSKNHYKLAFVSYAIEHSLEQLIPQVDQWTFQKICRLSLLLASAVRDLKDGVHPNLQPKNILISNIYEEHAIKLKLVDGQEDWPHIPLSPRYGRWPYISPEICYQYTNLLTQQSNIYSLGIILWQLASGVIFPTHVPVCSNLYKITPLKHIHPAYQELIGTCLQKDPNSRPSADTICDTLTHILIVDMSTKFYSHSLRVNEIRDRQLIIAKYLAHNNQPKRALQELMEGASLSKRMIMQVTLSLGHHYQENTFNNQSIYYNHDLPDLVQLGYV
ncbi:kinase-like domain-containing protein, partial [Thamnidium elegans]